MLAGKGGTANALFEVCMLLQKHALLYKLQVKCLLAVGCENNDAVRGGMNSPRVTLSPLQVEAIMAADRKQGLAVVRLLRGPNKEQKENQS